jgi:hypothetical protein
MNKVIVYATEVGDVHVVALAGNSGLTLEDVAARVVPEGAPYHAVDPVDVPAGPTERATWAGEVLGLVATAPVPDLERDLTRAEFNGMLAAKRFKGVWDAMRAALETMDGDEAEGLRFQLEANLHKTVYNLTATLFLVSEFRDFATSLNAEYAVMLTDESITAAWKETAARVAAL